MNQHSRTIAGVLLTILAFAASACSSQGPRPAPGVTDEELANYRERISDDLRGYIELETPQPVRTADNLLQVTVPIRNVTDEEVHRLVQAQFLDGAGVPVGDETNRRLFIVPRSSTKAFQATSRTSSAADYVVQIWRARQ